jgi:FOG: PKD repeat
MKRIRNLILCVAFLLLGGNALSQSTCNLTSGLQNDVKQNISGGTASSYQAGENINNSYDGNISTLYHSSYNGGGFPITLDYKFNKIDRIDYLIYRPRTSGDNGLFMATEIWYSTKSAPTSFKKMCDYNFNGSNTDVRVNFNTPIANPATIRIIVKSGVNNFASCAEMEFYKAVSFDSSTYPNIFRDNICSWLKPGVTQADINSMPSGFQKSLAQCMYNGTYDTSYYRIQKYEPYPLLSTTATTLKTSGYCQFENPTGIYFDANSIAMIFVENTFGQPISLKVFDYSTNATSLYQLNTGLNKLSITSKGLGYVSYYTDNYASLQPVKMHITTGRINGYYDINKTTSAQWQSMLNNAVSNMIDLKGKYINMHYDVASLKTYSPTDAKDLVNLYDTIVRTEHEQMGLYKFSKVPKNHMYAEADNGSWSWYAGDRGAHYSGSVDVTCSASNAKNGNIWGVAHELGHVNQIRPGLEWVSTTEVTNNIYSVWNTYLYSNAPYNRKLEVENINDAYYDGYETGTGFGKGNDIVGGRMNAYLNNGIVKRERWLCQYGPDAMRSSGSEPDWKNGNGDHFVKLCALWQLMLYYQVAHPEKKDWFGIVAEKVRNTNESGLTNGQLMVNFMKNTCDAVGEDLTDFFRKAGMLRTYDNYMNDYTSAQLTITAADSAGVGSYVTGKGYPKPESPVIYYISSNSVDAYKNKLSVEGTQGLGCTPMLSASEDYQKYVIVDHSVWKNVVAFETYNGNNLIRISMPGSGYENNNKTRVYYPSNATAIYAVAWDGSKKQVYPALPSKPLADFSASTTTVQTGGNVTFTDLSAFSPTSWSWTFQGGTPSASTAQNPTVTYSSTGTYSVTLTATNSLGSNTLAKNSYITVIPLASGIPNTNWTLKYVDSEEKVGENGAASNAFDGNAATFWHTQWYNGSPSYPHEIQIDLGATYSINGFGYLPRQDNSNGRIKDFEFYVSTDGISWILVKSGSGTDDPFEKTYAFTATNGRYVKLVGLNACNGSNYAGAAEIKVYGNLVGFSKSASIKSELTVITPEQNKNLIIYPNPAKSCVTIDMGNSFEESEDVRLFVLDMQGNTIINKNLMKNRQFEFSVDRLKKHAYVVKVVGRRNQLIGKLMVN